MATLNYYDVILKPVVTEKSMNGMSEKKYTFLVHPEANKAQINTINTYDIMKYSTVIATKAAVAKIEEVYA